MFLKSKQNYIFSQKKSPRLNANIKHFRAWFHFFSFFLHVERIAKSLSAERNNTRTHLHRGKKTTIACVNRRNFSPWKGSPEAKPFTRGWDGGVVEWFYRVEKKTYMFEMKKFRTTLSEGSYLLFSQPRSCTWWVAKLILARDLPNGWCCFRIFPLLSWTFKSLRCYTKNGRFLSKCHNFCSWWLRRMHIYI